MKLNKPYNLEEINCEVDGRGRALLCLHGLNQRPQALVPLLQDLNKIGFRPYLMHLPGHDGKESYKDLSMQKYKESYLQVYNYLTEISGEPPLFIGYSFGGLIGTSFFELCPYDRMVLLAPALQLRSYTLLLQPILPFLSRVSSVSFGDYRYEKRYRYHSKGVPREVYQCFFKIYRHLLFSDKSCLTHSDARVFSHPYDELISYPRLKRWIRNNTDWSFSSIDNSGAEFKMFNHLCFDRTTLGDHSYEALIDEISQYLS